MAQSAAQMSATSTHLDLPSRLQLSVSDLSGMYVNVLGNLQNAAETRAPDIEQMASELASQVVEAHRYVDELAAELGRTHRSENEQLLRIRELQEEGAMVTQALRLQTEVAGMHGPTFAAHPQNPMHAHTMRHCFTCRASEGQAPMRL